MNKTTAIPQRKKYDNSIVTITWYDFEGKLLMSNIDQRMRTDFGFSRKCEHESKIHNSFKMRGAY